MESGYKRVLNVVARECVARELPTFTPYPATKVETATFLPGSAFFRHQLASATYVYVVLSPAEGSECGFVVLLGWGYGEAIEAHNYLEQFRELGGNIWPTRQFASGFEQLQVLEGKRAAWGEKLPDLAELQVSYGAVTQEVRRTELCKAMTTAIARVKKVLSPFENAILATSE